MARRRSVMSEAMKYEMARDMGVADIVEREGWGGVTSRQCGNMVRLAIEKAEQMLRDNNINNS
ncbi:MAG: small, acid-soluble spore protein, alpha/beta type [Firmicutes bacterium]|nr:small, acid-soluble spore protein, alpha/beta type [Bacillota bacterium]